MSGLPTTWATTTLEHVSDIVRGITFPASVKAPMKTELNVCCLRTTNIQREIQWNNVYFVPREYVKRDAQLVQIGDVLMSMANSYELVGKVAVVRTIPYEAAFGAFLSAVRPREVILGQYLFHFLRSNRVQREIREGSSQTTNIANISVTTLSQIQVPLAPLNEQQRIADKLDKVLARVDACRERLDRIPAILKRFRQSVIASATSGKLTEDWRNANSGVETGLEVIAHDAKAKAAMLQTDASLEKKKSSANSEVDESYIFELPESWAFTTWGKLTEWITYGFTRPMPATAEGIKLVTAKDVSYFEIRFDKAGYTTATAFSALSDKDRPLRGDLLITKDGTIGRAAIVSSDEPFCINQSVAVCWLRSTSMNKRYIELVANTEFTQRFVADKAKGMAIQHLSITDLAQCPIPVPSLEEQSEIVRRVENLFAYADRIEARFIDARSKVDNLTPAMLAKAFRGELVPQDANDEPATELLKRIRTMYLKTDAKLLSRTKKSASRDK